MLSKLIPRKGLITKPCMRFASSLSDVLAAQVPKKQAEMKQLKVRVKHLWGLLW